MKPISSLSSFVHTLVFFRHGASLTFAAMKFYCCCSGQSLFCQKFLYAGKFYADNKYLCCFFKFINRREGRCNTDIAVFRVFAIWIGSSCSGHNDAGFFCHWLRSSLAHPSMDSKEMKYPPFGVVQFSDSKSAEFFLKGGLYHLKFRTKDCCMFAHVCMNTVKILEEFYMTKLIQFIMSDRLYGNIFAEYHPGLLWMLLLLRYRNPGS